MTTFLNTSAPVLDTLAVAMLQAELTGDLLQIGDLAYETARRLVNLRFDERPALIVRCHTTDDVARAVRFARGAELELAIRSGGHSMAGHSTGTGLMLDLSSLRAIAIDPAARIARVQPGATNGDLVAAAAVHGLATTTGTCATVGMGGSTLGGGIGWLMGRYGLTIDNVVRFEMVTAEGAIVTASADEHPELFWALRGGGGNFGVVTRIDYRLHPVTTVLGGVAIFPFERAREALRAYRDVSSAAPDELLMHAVMTTLPDFGPAVIVQACYSGDDLAVGMAALAPLRALGPAVDAIAPRPYAELYMMLTPPMLPGASFFDTAYTLQHPGDAALDQMIALAAERPSPFSLINVHQVHGAATRVPADATAFALREPHYAIANIGMWLDGSGAAETDWSRRARQQMQPYAGAGLYSNFLTDEGETGIRASYRANYERLVAVKSQYDPANVFHRNQNIRPAEPR